MEVFLMILLICSCLIAFCGFAYFLIQMFVYDFLEALPHFLFCLFLVVVWGCALYSGYKDKGTPKEILVVRCLKND